MNHPRPSLPRTLAWLAFFIALWWLVPGVFRRVARETFHEFQAPLFVAQSRLKDLREYWVHASRSSDELISAGRDLARVNEHLKLRDAEASGIRAENRRLEEALGLPSRPELRQIVSRVAQRDIGRWWSRIILAKGANHGIRKGCAVVNGGGVVGRVVVVHAFTCEVQLVTDPEFRISAIIEGDERPVVFRGVATPPMAKPMGEVTHIAADYAPELGRFPRLATSGLGGVFPAGLFIGEMVADPQVTSDGLFREGRVAVRPDLHDIQEASVLVPVTGELLPPEGP